ncbi:MAG: hypothetical protein KGZ72_06515 [Roseovarius sp.]|jgi:hypothetical protein|nr:hypothetical protein [Roseovarius sp.]
MKFYRTNPQIVEEKFFELSQRIHESSFQSDLLLMHELRDMCGAVRLSKPLVALIEDLLRRHDLLHLPAELPLRQTRPIVIFTEASPWLKVMIDQAGGSEAGAAVRADR